MKWIDLVDHYAVNSVILPLAVFESIAFCHFYGVTRICENVKSMLGKEPSKLFQICWKFITPTLLVGILTGYIFFAQTDEIDKMYTPLQHFIGHTLRGLFIAPFPIYMLYKILNQQKEPCIEVKQF